MKNMMIVSSLMMVLSVSAFAKENMSADAQAVDAACTQDAATASCGSEKVGTGLMKCIHAYKKSHADFKVSPGCKTAMKTMHHDHKTTK